MSTDESIDVSVSPVTLPLADFLESKPPNQLLAISDLTGPRHWGGDPIQLVGEIHTPDLQLHCTSDKCNGLRFFRCSTQPRTIGSKRFTNCYLTYVCSNCQVESKIFSLAVKLDEDVGTSGECYKFGEFPPFGPPTPARLITLIGQDRDEFLKGRRCENQGLGVGAFIYYRRVVENQKNRILSEIIKVAEKIGAGADATRILEAAVRETQFSKALSMAKDAIPQSLLINGHSPLALLHGALSEGVHDRSDEECLEIASSVRVILAELSERLAQALKDEAELSKALSTLMGSREKKKSSGN
jgi:hypothetical protein